MDKRFIVIMAVLIVEVFMRWLYPHIAIDGLTYTLITRTIQLGIILGVTLDLCGIKTTNLARELVWGLGISAAFAVIVLASDLASRLMIPGGVLERIILRQDVRHPALFFLVGCVFAPLVEELYFRGLIYAWIRPKLPAVLAVLISAVLFASMHGYFAPVQLIGGITFAAVFEWRRNIWAAYVLHVLANTGIWLLPYVYPVFWRLMG